MTLLCRQSQTILCLYCLVVLYVLECVRRMEGVSLLSYVYLQFCAVIRVFIWKRTCSSDINVIRQPIAVTLRHTSFPLFSFFDIYKVGLMCDNICVTTDECNPNNSTVQFLHMFISLSYTVFKLQKRCKSL